MRASLGERNDLVFDRRFALADLELEDRMPAALIVFQFPIRVDDVCQPSEARNVPDTLLILECGIGLLLLVAYVERECVSINVRHLEAGCERFVGFALLLTPNVIDEFAVLPDPGNAQNRAFAKTDRD